MADVKVQRGIATIPTTTGSVTITAGTDYTAPSSATAAFCRVVNAYLTSGGEDTATDTAQPPEDRSVSVSGTITTSITFTRYDGTDAQTVRVAWEIIEYIGTAGAANEFIVRGVEAIAVGSTDLTTDSGTVSGVVTDGDVVVFITGQRTSSGTNTAYPRQLFTSEWVGGATDVARVTRATTGGGTVAVCSVAVVEFTGSNWKVQRVPHTFVAVDTDETETIPVTIGSTSKAFLHVQFATAQIADAQDWGQRTKITSTSQITFRQDGSALSSSTAVAWLVENTQSDGTPMVVQHLSGTWASGAAGPATTGVTVTEVAALATTSIMGECSWCNTGNATGYWIGPDLRLTSVTNVELWRTGGDYALSYEFDVVQWPTVAAAATTDTDAATLAESVALLETVGVTDAATGDDTAALLEGCSGTDAATQSDVAAVQDALAVVDALSLSEATALTETTPFTDAASLSETAVLLDTFVVTDSATLTDSAVLGAVLAGIALATAGLTARAQATGTLASRAAGTGALAARATGTEALAARAAGTGTLGTRAKGTVSAQPN